jgi:hypothetical protein
MPLAAVRVQVGYSVFVPTTTPTGLVPDQPLVDNPCGTWVVQITYRAADGTAALVVLNGPSGCCLDSDPRRVGLPVALPNGLAAHYLGQIGAQYGGDILWWEQSGSYVALSGPRLTRDDLVRIAASLSPIADLGQTPPAWPDRSGGNRL